MPEILVPVKQRITIPHYPYPICWRKEKFEGMWAEEGYNILILCRGARIHAKKVTCSAKSFYWQDWNKAYGALWLCGEGDYEIRHESKDLVRHHEAIDLGGFATTEHSPQLQNHVFGYAQNPPLAYRTSELTGYLPGYEED